MKEYERQCEAKRMAIETESFQKNVIIIKEHWVEKLLQEEFAGRTSGRGKGTALIAIKQRKKIQNKRIKVTIPSDPDELLKYQKIEAEKAAKIE